MFFGCRSRPLDTPLLALWLLPTFAAACSEPVPHELSLSVRFACGADRERADELTLRIVRGGCDGDESVYEAILAKGEQAEPAKGIAAGIYGLVAEARSEGALLASQCVEATLPRRRGEDSPALFLRSDGCDAPDEPSLMDAGGAEDLPGEDGESASCADDCSDPFPCTEDRCMNGQCIHEPITGMRECDGVACTENDRCELGTCQPGAPNDALCPDDGNPCTAETCEPGSGCNRDNVEGASCNDQIDCTSVDTCKGGICRGVDGCSDGGVCSAASGMCTACTGNADCDDRDPCTTDSCSAGMCSNTPNTATCNDGKSCTVNDVCKNRVCAGTSACPADATCGGSNCRCNDSSRTLCSNTCVNLTNTTQHCGQCGRACGSGASCQNSACKPSAASNCTAYRFGGHDYLMCVESVSWTTARERCRSYGFGLAIVETQAENDFLRTRPNAADRWFGANDRGSNGDNCRLDEEEGTWYWAAPNNTNSDNFKLFCAFANRNATTCTAMNGGYQNWRSGEPNNAGCDSCGIGDCSDGEDCGVFNADGTWNDAACNSGLGFICETP